MRQHVNPLSKHFNEIECIPPLSQIFENPKLPLHLDIGSASGDFLFQLALENKNWNYLGVEIREQLVKNAKLRASDQKIQNLYFVFGNAYNILKDSTYQFLISYMRSISFNFPDPWFKKKHHKRRVIEPKLINILSNSMQKGSLIFIKTDVKDLYLHMDNTISKNLNFKKLFIKDCNFADSFNPNQIQTNREKYVNIQGSHIFEAIYTKI